MTQEQQPGTTQQTSPAGKAIASPGRRRFVTGLATGSVLMTVASKPAMAGTWCTPSAWVSGNLSREELPNSCGGRSPGFWRTQDRQWPSHYKPGTCKNSGPGNCNVYNGDGTPFHQAIGDGTGPFFGTTFGDHSMMQVIWKQGHGDPYQLGAHICAALLNAATIPEYGMSEHQVIEIWYQLETQGFYQPSAGDLMTKQDVVAFIQNTFG